MPSVAALRKQIRQADTAYRQGTPLLSDTDFDALVAQLRTVAPYAPELQQPGGGTALLSLDNRDLSDWWNETQPAGVVVQPKIDGVAFALRYVDGTLTAAWTRSGKCALAAAQLVRDIPKQLSGVDAALRGTFEVTGELWSDDHKQSTPAASLRRKAVSGAGLRFTAYSAPHAHTTRSDETSSIDLLSRLTFQVPDTLLCTKQAEVEQLHTAWLSGCTFRSWPTDGIVVKHLSHAAQQELGCTTIAPRWALALKR
jgi:DNA ligase (NAD+)